jgi:hypothetical protein
LHLGGRTLRFCDAAELILIDLLKLSIRGLKVYKVAPIFGHPMVSKLWLNLLLWGLGDRVEKRNDYKTDILMVLNVMTWYAMIIFSWIYSGLFWFIAIIDIPASWIGTQILVGYLLVKGARSQQPREAKPVKSSPRQVMAPSPSSSRPSSESEEP